MATFALVLATAWFMKQQNDRAKKAQSTELFLQLRQRAISPEHAARRRRVIALLKHLEERDLSTRDLKFSPDINLLLNDYEWIGRLVKDDALQMEYAWSTYGRNLLLLYRKLEPYIEKERRCRKYRTLWEDVSDLYNKFKQLDKNALDNNDIEKQLKIERRWLRPATILKEMGEEIDLDRVSQDVYAQYQGVVSRCYFMGRDERRQYQYYVDYFKFPGAPEDETRNNLALPQFTHVAPQLDPLIRKVWPTYNDATVASTIAKFDTFAQFALAYHDGKLVAFNRLFQYLLVGIVPRSRP